MSTINQIQLPNGSTYDFEDTAAREAASSKADKTLATTSADGLMSKEDKAKLDGLSDSGIHYVPFKLVDDTACSTTDSFDTVMSMIQSNKPVQASVNADDKVMSLPVFMYDAETIMFRNDEMYIILAKMTGDSVLAIYGPTITDKLYDNDTTETSGQAALDAHMGKVLSDRINQLAKNTAQIETAGTATNAHSEGEYVMISNALYKVAASVAEGDTWIIGTNVTAANVGSEINALVSKTDNMKASFQVGVDGIYDAITAQGTTPASKSQSDVQAAISTLANDAYNNGFANGYNNVNPQISAGNMGVTSISAQITSGRALVFVHFWSSANPPSDITISSGSYVKLYDGKRNFGVPLYAMKIYKVTGINSGTFTVRANNVTENQCSIGIVSY